MDLNITGFITKGVSEGILAGFIYDIVSLSLAFILIKLFYEQIYMRLKWGNWKIKVFSSDESSDFEGTERILLPKKAKEIINDMGEFSIYVKGVVASTNTWLNVDISSDKAKEIGLTKLDKTKREICIDVHKNPQKPKPFNFTKETQQQIDEILELLKRYQKEEINIKRNHTTPNHPILLKKYRTDNAPPHPLRH